MDIGEGKQSQQQSQQNINGDDDLSYLHQRMTENMIR